jgi:HAD superfamily hydrolase (TIGR01509 family)
MEPARVQTPRLDKSPEHDLIIFDCDGVLVGYPISAEQVRERFLGRTARDATLEVERELGRPLSETYDLERRTALLAALADGCEAIPHLNEALDAIAVPMCVASSAAHEKIFTTLSRTGLYHRFAPNIFSSSQVANGKPAPDLFLFAARQMTVLPGRCVVIEDSLPGVAGAFAAGMTVLGFYGGSHCRAGDDAALRAAGAVATFDDMRRLPDLVAAVATS